jgi:signal transduction histidine kinase
VDALRPGPLEAGRLSDALAGVAERWSALHGVPVQVTTTGTARPLPPDAEVALLRTAQEALAKHAQAARVGLSLSYMDPQVALDVRDDGRGFDPAEANGFGLVAMRQRIEALSRTLQVESEPGTGTAISASLPAEAAGTPEAAGAQAPETAQAPQRPKGQAHEPLRRRPHQAADRGRSPGGQGRAEQHVRA